MCVRCVAYLHLAGEVEAVARVHRRLVQLNLLRLHHNQREAQPPDTDTVL
jgi:hypothetical protein